MVKTIFIQRDSERGIRKHIFRKIIPIISTPDKEDLSQGESQMEREN